MISYLLLLLLLCSPSHPIPDVEQYTICKVEDSLSFSAIRCSFFILLSQFTRKVFSEHSQFLWGEICCQKWIWPGHCAQFFLLQCHSLHCFLHRFIKVGILPSYSHQNHFPTSWWVVAMVGNGKQGLVGSRALGPGRCALPNLFSLLPPIALCPDMHGLLEHLVQPRLLYYWNIMLMKSYLYFLQIFKWLDYCRWIKSPIWTVF